MSTRREGLIDFSYFKGKVYDKVSYIFLLSKHSFIDKTVKKLI